MTDLLFPLTQDELMAVFRQKYSKSPTLGWGPRMRLESGYFTPDDHYEALVGRLLRSGSDWCDVGCGRNMFPENPELARQYAERCNYVFGIDPDDNVRENRFVHEYFQGLVEDCPTERQFDLVTLRMVAEHIEYPDSGHGAGCLAAETHGTRRHLHALQVGANVDRGERHAFGLHNPLKRLLWNSEARDTFPTQYKLNTRADIGATRIPPACRLPTLNGWTIAGSRTRIDGSTDSSLRLERGSAHSAFPTQKLAYLPSCNRISEAARQLALRAA